MQETDIITNEELETGDKTVYEASFLLDSSLSEEEAQAKYQEFSTFLTEKGAEIIAEGKLESKKLAYTMSIKRDSKRKDHSKAYFTWIKFDLEPSAVADFDKVLKSDSSVVRYLVIKTVRESTLREPVEGIDDMEENVEEEGEIEVEAKEEVAKKEADVVVEEEV